MFLFFNHIAMDDWNLDENLLSKWHYLQHCKSKMPDLFLQGMTNNVRFTLSVGWHYVGGLRGFLHGIDSIMFHGHLDYF